MFVVVNVKDSGKRKVRKGRTVDSVREYLTSGGERFYITDVLDSDTGVNWAETAAFIGRHSKHVLLSKNIVLPENCPVQRFDALKYKNILLFNTVGLILRQMFLAGCRPSCFINDPDGQYAFLLPRVARFSAQTTVSTRKNYLYYPHVSSLYIQYGAGVTVTDKNFTVNDGTVIIDTSGDMQSGSDMYFSVFGNGISPKYTDGFNDIKAMCPPYIDTVDFLGAVYEFNRDKRLENSVCRVFELEGEKLNVSELAESLINRKIGDSGRLFFAYNLTCGQ